MMDCGEDGLQERKTIVLDNLKVEGLNVGPESPFVGNLLYPNLI